MEKFKMQNFLFDFDGGRLRTLAMRLPLQLKHALRTLALKFHPLKRCDIIWGFRSKPLFRN